MARLLWESKRERRKNRGFAWTKAHWLADDKSSVGQELPKWFIDLLIDKWQPVLCTPRVNLRNSKNDKKVQVRLL